MKKGLLCVTLTLFMLLSLAVPGVASAAENVQAVYLGVVDYGTVTSANKDNFQYNFAIGSEVVTYKISNANNYAINNIMSEGYVFDITVEDGVVVAASLSSPSAAGQLEVIEATGITVSGQVVATNAETKVYKITTTAGGATVMPATLTIGESVKVYGTPAKAIYLTFVAEPYDAPLKGIPGERTLKNFLATSFEPVGTVLYIYGGSWDWQDVGSSNQATTIGLSQSWIDFFQSQDENFIYRYNDDYSKSYYPHRAYNEYYYAGADCSGYVGWAMYNVMNKINGQGGYVMSSTQMANNFANTRGLGTFVKATSASTFKSTSFEDTDFKPGDIYSMSGHTWICLGVCEDGSMLILNSTPSNARTTGYGGGGVQLNGISASSGPGANTATCQAALLAKEYMQRYFPAWSERYDARCNTYSGYVTSTTGTSPLGKFSWHLDERGLTDPDGYANMTADQILADLFGEGAETFTVSFVDGETELFSQNVSAGALAQKPEDPVKEGYDFGGWLLDGEEFDFDTPVSANITLTALWTKGSNLRLTTTAKNLKAGDEFTLSTYFVEGIESNAAILNFTFATDKFAYEGFAPADGVSVLLEEATETGMRITVMVQNYDTVAYGELKLSALQDLSLADSANKISVAVSYVLRHADAPKEVVTVTASTTFGDDSDEPWWDGETYDLINMSNMIDAFGMTSEDKGWYSCKNLDFNENGEIDINDIAIFAERIGK